MSIKDVCQDVRLFLNGLARELPDIFPPPRVCRPRFVRRATPPKGADTAARREAKDLILARVRHWAQLLNLEYRRVFVKDQRTLWGSCSARKNLNFNWRLAAAPLEALDYVVIHELCHLREMNHSKRFWDHVRAACPDYKVHRRWLRDNSALVRKGGSLLFPQAVNCDEI
ncbi:MAG: M48 family metallopeptidase [Elusimicrobiales bacterium]|nr:M48 family metallopeptidase [Elusimicrobiales bacterium]